MLAVATHRLERIELGLAHAAVLVAVDAIECGDGMFDALGLGRRLALASVSTGTLLDLLPKAARAQLVSVSADTARTLAGLDGVSRTYQESLSEYEPAGDTVLIVTDTQTLAAIGTENYTVLRDYGDVYWDVRMNINDLTENFTTDFILPEAPRYGVGRNNK